MPKDDLVVLFGASGTFKSFLAIDMALHIAHGLPWLGRKTAAGSVVYVAAEGAGGLRKRLAAYARHHSISLADWNLVLSVNLVGDFLRDRFDPRSGIR